MKNLSEQLHEHLLAEGWENRGKKTGSYRTFIDDDNWLTVGVHPAKLTSPKFKGRPCMHPLGAGVSHRGVHELFDELFHPQGFRGFVSQGLERYSDVDGYFDPNYLDDEPGSTFDEVLQDLAKGLADMANYTGPDGMRRGIEAFFEPGQRKIYRLLTIDIYEGTWSDKSEDMIDELYEIEPRTVKESFIEKVRARLEG